MNNREPLEAAMAGIANFLSKTIMITLKVLGALFLIVLLISSGIIAGVLKRK